MAESAGGGKLPLAPSQPPASPGGREHLGEVPTLDEVPGQVSGGWAMDNHSNVAPRHPGCGRPVNEIWGSQRRGQGWLLGDTGGREEEQLTRGKAAVFPDPARPILSPGPDFCPRSKLSGTLGGGDPHLQKAGPAVPSP